MKRIHLPIFFLAFTLFVHASYVSGMMQVEVKKGTLNGMVYKKNNSGISGLTVRLVPTKEAAAQNKPEKVTTTDKNGRFSFTKIYKGKYLLELYKGITLIYRDVIDTSKDTRKIIELKEAPQKP